MNINEEKETPATIGALIDENGRITGFNETMSHVINIFRTGNTEKIAKLINGENDSDEQTEFRY